MPTEIEGLRQLVKNLEAAGVAVQDLKDAFSAISTKAADLASGFAPKRSGTLARSVKGSKTKNKAVVRAGSRRVPYAAPINYGWRRHRIEPSRFMQRADEAIRSDVVPIIETNLNRILSEQHLA